MKEDYKNKEKKDIDDLGTIAPFQNKTANKAVEKYKTHNRILIADEVGLGKTFTASRIIQLLAKDKADQLSAKDKAEEPFRVLYMTNNETLAKEGIRKLKPKSGYGAQNKTKVLGISRLIELFKKNNNQSDSKDGAPIEIYSSSQGIVFMTRSDSNEDEREIIYNICKKCKDEISKYNDENKEDINHCLDYLCNSVKFFKGKNKKNKKNEYEDKDLNKEYSLKDIAEYLYASFCKENLQDDNNYPKVFSDLRWVLTKYLAKEKKFDLIIVDEFHKYLKKETMKSLDEILFSRSDTKLLLLSATPYKPDYSKADKEFLKAADTQDRDPRNRNDHFNGVTIERLLKFLVCDTEEPNDQQTESLKKYSYYSKTLRDLKKRANNLKENDASEILSDFWKEYLSVIKNCEQLYSEYILRTERTRLLELEDDMFTESLTDSAKIEEDLYLWKEASVCRAAIKNTKNKKNLITYCKSTPFPLSFADGYNDWNEIEKKRDTLVNGDCDCLLWNGNYADGEHRKQDKLIKEGIENTELLGQILWIPPLLHNQDLGKPFNKLDKQFTKTLVFMRYHMSAKSAAAMINGYEPVRCNDDNIQCKQIDEQINGFESKNYCRHLLSGSDSDESLIKDLNNAFKEYFKKHKAVLIRAGVGKDFTLKEYCDNGCLGDVLREMMYVNNIHTYSDFYSEGCALLIEVLCRKDKPFIEYYSSKSGEKERLNCHFAEKYEMDNNSAVQVHSFNSPFYPFIFTTTYALQEGMDLHLYCHQIMHWDVAANPISFEQREGRINRRLCHFVRKRIVQDYLKYNQEKDKNHTWGSVMEYAEKKYDNKTGIIPWWYYPTEADENEPNYSIKRITVKYPLESFEEVAYKYGLYLCDQYRMAIGTALNNTGIIRKLKIIIGQMNDGKQYKIDDIMMDLSPYRNENIDPYNSSDSNEK